MSISRHLSNRELMSESMSKLLNKQGFFRIARVWTTIPMLEDLFNQRVGVRCLVQTTHGTVTPSN